VNAPGQVRALAERRSAARAARDFAEADALREAISKAGWIVHDTADGFTLEPLVSGPEPTLSASSVESVLLEPVTFDASVQWVCEGWPEDIVRAITAFRAHASGRTLQFVVADVKGGDPARFGEDVEVLSLEPDTGWAAARNAGLRRSRGQIVLAMDGSVEPSGDIIGPLLVALTDPTLGVTGPFGIVTRDLRQFDEAPEVGPCDAVEGYLMAFRRTTLVDVGGFDEKFRWYRTADIEWSFRVKDAGMRCEVIHLPVAKHEHRMWFETDPAARAKWSKRNFYRFLDRFRDRWDLILSGEPEHQERDHEGDRDRDEPATLPEGR